MYSLKFVTLTAFKICLRCKQVSVYKMHTYSECQKTCSKLLSLTANSRRFLQSKHKESLPLITIKIMHRISKTFAQGKQNKTKCYGFGFSFRFFIYWKSTSCTNLKKHWVSFYTYILNATYAGSG